MLLNSKELAIIQAAAKIFSEKGYNGTTTKEIAQEARLSEGSIFRYFENKMDILHHILTYIIEIVVPKLAVIPLEMIFSECKGKTPEEVIKIVVKNRWEIINENINFIRAVLSEIHFHPDLQQIYKEKVFLPIVRLIEQYIEDGINSGIFRPVDVSMTARAVIGMFLVFPFNQVLTNNDELDFEQYQDRVIRTIIDLLFYGIRNG